MIAILMNGSFPLIPFVVNSIKSINFEGKPVLVVCDTISSRSMMKFLLRNTNSDVVYTVFEEYLSDNTIVHNSTSTEIFELKVWFPDIERATYYNLPFPTFDECIEIQSKFGAYLNHIKDIYHINKFVYEPVSNAYSYIMHDFAQRHSINYVGIHQSRIKGLVDVVPIAGSMAGYSYLDRIDIDKEFRVNRIEAYNNFAKDIFNPRPYHVIQKNSKKIYYNTLFALFKFYYLCISKQKLAYFQYPKPLSFITKRIINKLIYHTKLRLNKKSSGNNKQSDEYYIYFSHFHPESSTSVLAPTMINDEAIIQSLSANLRNKMLIKLHPSSISFISKEFLKFVSKHPLLEFTDIASHNLINSEKCIGVITVAGTVGLESIVFEKNVHVLSEVFYSCNPKVNKVTSDWALKECLFESHPKDDKYTAFKYFEIYSIKSESILNDWRFNGYDQPLRKVLCA